MCDPCKDVLQFLIQVHKDHDSHTAVKVVAGHRQSKALEDYRSEHWVTVQELQLQVSIELQLNVCQSLSTSLQVQVKASPTANSQGVRLIQSPACRQ